MKYVLIVYFLYYIFKNLIKLKKFDLASVYNVEWREYSLGELIFLILLSGKCKYLHQITNYVLYTLTCRPICWVALLSDQLTQRRQPLELRMQLGQLLVSGRRSKYSQVCTRRTRPSSARNWMRTTERSEQIHGTRPCPDHSIWLTFPFRLAHLISHH